MGMAPGRGGFIPRLRGAKAPIKLPYFFLGFNMCLVAIRGRLKIGPLIATPCKLAL